MKSKIKSQKGITLVALVITIIVLIILSGITIGKIAGNKGNINQTKNAVALSELSKVQQAVMETYIKYKQLNNSSLLIGTVIDNTNAQSLLTEVKPGESLKANDSDKIEYKYYSLTKQDLITLGLENIQNDNEYIVNYSTGEVFNITQKQTINKEALYVYAKDLRNE